MAVVDFSCFGYLLAEAGQHFRIVGAGIAAQVGKGSTFSHTVLSVSQIGHPQVPYLPGMIDTAGSTCRLFEVQGAGDNFYLILHMSWVYGIRI